MPCHEEDEAGTATGRCRAPQLRLDLLNILPLQADADHLLMRISDGSVHFNDGYDFPRCQSSNPDKLTKPRKFSTQFTKVTKQFAVSCPLCDCL